MEKKSFGNRRTKRKNSTKHKTRSRRKVQYGSAYPFVNIERMTQTMLNGIEEVYHDKTEEINKLKQQIASEKKIASDRVNNAERELEQQKQITNEMRNRLDEKERKMKQYIEKKRVEDKKLDAWYFKVTKTVEQKNDEISNLSEQIRKLRKNAHRHRTSRGKGH
jgi:DNA repair exonuclease SbcCD ATPase subunit